MNNSGEPLTPSSTSSSAENLQQNNLRKKSKRIKMLLIIFLILVAILGILLVINNLLINNGASLSDNPFNDDLSPTKTVKVVDPTINTINLNDDQTKLYYSINDRLYAKTLDGTEAREVVTLPNKIVSIETLLNGKLSIQTDASKYSKKTDYATGQSYYKLEKAETDFHVFDPQLDIFEALDEFESEQIAYFKDNKAGEKYFVKELPSGQADIYVEKFNDTEVERIGQLTEKYIAQQCDAPPDCQSAIHPSGFYPSFDGSYLVNKLRGGGGLGQPGLVVSRDGKLVYKIDFYWFLSAAIWISNDSLLTRGQLGEQKIYTFKPDGSFTEKIPQVDLGGYFSPSDLSPSRNFLVISNTNNDNQFSYYDIEKDLVVPVEVYDQNSVVERFKISTDEVKRHTNKFLGWNLASDKILYAETFEVMKTNQSSSSILMNEIKLFDLKSKKVVVVASFQNSYDKNNSSQTEVEHFSIR